MQIVGIYEQEAKGNIGATEWEEWGGWEYCIMRKFIISSLHQILGWSN
jgi:hypothetical protein